MSRLRSGSLRCLLAAVVAVVLLPRSATGQAVTGTISGTVVDPQGQVIPGATVTVTNEANNDARVAVTDVRGDFQVTNLQPGQYTVRIALESFRTLERKNIVLSAGERLAVPNLALEVGSVGETVTVEARGTHVNTAETQHSGLITSTQIEQIQVLGRDVTSIMRLLPGVRYENTVDSLGMSFGTDVPNVGGARRRLEQRHRGRRGRERGRRQPAHGAANQPGRDLRGQGAAEHLPRRVRPRRRRPGADRQQGRRRRTTAGTSTTTCRNEAFNANNFFNNRSNIKKPRYRFNTFGANLGGPVPGPERRREEAVFLLLAGGADRQPAGPGAQLDDADRPRRCRGTSRRRSTARGGSSTSRIRSGSGWRATRSGRPARAASPATSFPAEPHQLERRGAAEHAAARQQLRPRTSRRGSSTCTTQENAENPKMNNIVRVDWRPTQRDNFYFTFKDWYSDQRGSEVTAGPNKWGFFNTHYLNTDRGISVNYTRIIRPNLVLDSDFGTRQQTEQFYPLTDADWTRINRDTVGFNVGQFHPELNPAQCHSKSPVRRQPAERAELHVRQPAGGSGRGVADVGPLAT